MQTVLITGANRGIGLEFVRQYANDGWNVIACCRNSTDAVALQKLAQDTPSIRIETLDVLDATSIDQLTKKLSSTTIDLLINNAGIFSGTGTKGNQFANNNDDRSQSFGSLDATAWAKVLTTNAIAPIMVTEKILPLMTKNKNGKIIMISSRMGSIDNTQEGDIAYRSSKAALNAAMRNISITLRPQNITVISMHPGWVKTDMGGAYADLTPQQSVEGMRRVIDQLKLEKSGCFFGYDGQEFAW